MVYECKYCNYQTKIKSNYKKHLNTNKHLKNIENEGIEDKNEEKSIKSIAFESIVNQKVSEPPPQKLCQWCTRPFSRTDNLYRHIRYCKYKIKSPKHVDNTSTTNTINDLRCNYCHNNYKNKNSLNRHIKTCFSRKSQIDNLEQEKEKLEKEKEKIILEKDLEKEKAVNIEKDKAIELAKDSKSIYNITNNNNRTITYLNINYGNMIAMEQFLHNFEHKEQLSFKERENLLISYKENGIDVFARIFSYIMKQNCKRQLEKEGLGDMKLLPLFCSDGNLRSHKEKGSDGWKTHYDNSSINKMLNISNNQVYESHNEMLPIVGKERTRIFKEIKRDNHQNKLKTIKNK